MNSELTENLSLILLKKQQHLLAKSMRHVGGHYKNNLKFSNKYIDEFTEICGEDIIQGWRGILGVQRIYNALLGGDWSAECKNL